MIMKAIFLIAILLLSFLFDLQAQIQLKAGFDLSIYNPSANQFFDRYQDIDHIVMYNVGDDEILDIYFQGHSIAPTERYTLTFDGDLHLFNKKYKQFPLPKEMDAKLTYLQGIKKMADVSSMYHLMTTLQRDSLKHHFSFYTYTGSAKPKVDLSYYHPVFKGDILKLTRKLEQKFKQWKPIVVTDSIIIMTGIVDEKGAIGKLQLIEGRTSVYSNKVLDFMSGEVTSWWPKFDGGGKRPWQVRMSVRVNKDESMKVAIL